MCFQWCFHDFNQVTGQGSQSGQGSQIFKGGQQEKVAQIVQLLGDIKEQCKWASYRTGVSASKLTSMEFRQFLATPSITDAFLLADQFASGELWSLPEPVAQVVAKMILQQGEFQKLQTSSCAGGGETGGSSNAWAASKPGSASSSSQASVACDASANSFVDQ